MLIRTAKSLLIGSFLLKSKVPDENNRLVFLKLKILNFNLILILFLQYLDNFGNEANEAFFTWNIGGWPKHRDETQEFRTVIQISSFISNNLLVIIIYFNFIFHVVKMSLKTMSLFTLWEDPGFLLWTYQICYVRI